MSVQYWVLACMDEANTQDKMVLLYLLMDFGDALVFCEQSVKLQVASVCCA